MKRVLSALILVLAVQVSWGSALGLPVGRTTTTTNINFPGIIENKSLRFHVFGANVLPVERTTSSNVIGGFSGISATSASLTAAVARFYYGSIGAARGNTADGWYATVGGGYWNSASGDWATVGGGYNNTAGVAVVTVRGGYGSFATVGGGRSNTASGRYATVSGGEDNNASAWFATVGGGEDNNASAWFATVGGGSNNEAKSYCATVGGGSSNHATVSSATVGGGYDNEAGGAFATVPGGSGNSATASYSFAAGRRAKAEDQGAFVWADSSNFDFDSGETDEFAVRCTGGARFVTAIDVTTGAPTTWAQLATGSGSWAPMSDRNVKENFTPMDGRDILKRLASIPVESWNYKSQDVSIRHMGPMAQDFHSAFGLGEDDRHISTIDADGVALAAIQGLYELVREKDAQIVDLKARVEALEALVLSSVQGQ